MLDRFSAYLNVVVLYSAGQGHVFTSQASCCSWVLAKRHNSSSKSDAMLASAIINLYSTKTYKVRNFAKATSCFIQVCRVATPIYPAPRPQCKSEQQARKQYMEHWAVCIFRVACGRCVGVLSPQVWFRRTLVLTYKLSSQISSGGAYNARAILKAIHDDLVCQWP